MRQFLHSLFAANLQQLNHFRPRWHSLTRTPFLFLVPGAIVSLVLVSLPGCATTLSQNGKTYEVHVSLATPPIGDAPTDIDQTYTATCSAGQSVLAGGFNLSGPQAIVDWAAAHPAPSGAQTDSNGLYRPIPQLVRVVDSEPTSDGNGWTIRVIGHAYPASSRPIAVYAYCAAGLTPPLYVKGPVTSTNDPGKSSVATCPQGTIVSGGGYSAGSYDNGAGGYLPIYSSLPDTSTTWLVAPDFAPLVTPVPNAIFVSFGVCVSTQDFSLANGDYQDIPINFSMQGNQASQVGGDTDFAYQHPTTTTCPGGSFPLPPAFDFTQSLPVFQHSEDLRIDGTWIDDTLTTWSLDLSVGGAATYPQGDLIDGDVFIGCLLPQ